MKIQGPNFVHAPQSISGPHRASATQGTQSSSLREVDQLDISAAAQSASRSLESSGIRHDRVAQLRAAIQSGTYETEEKMSAALDRLLDQIG